MNILEELGVGGDVEVKELGLGASWIVLEDDLMSLEKGPGVIRDLYLVSPRSVLHLRDEMFPTTNLIWPVYTLR